MNGLGYDDEIAAAQASVDTIQDLFTHRETIDAWLHERTLQFVRPIVDSFPNASWLTVGDEGTDAWMLQRYGVRKLTASSLSSARLRRAAELGHLKNIDIRALNAEHLDLPDSSFDFILCCQAYHHIRRAPLAIYEFMRVARYGFILIEPFEGRIGKPLDALRTFAKMLLRRRRPKWDVFEPTGNFIYRVSERELFHMFAAVQLPWFAIKTFNSFYLTSLALKRQDSLLASLLLKTGIGVQNLLSFSGLMSPEKCVVFVPTGQETAAVSDRLRSAHFRVVKIPRNPYLPGPGKLIPAALESTQQSQEHAEV